MHTFHSARVVAALLVGTLLLACERAPAPGAEPAADGVVRQPIPAGVDRRMVEWRSDGVLIPSQDSLRKTPGYVIDSLFTPEENLRRFQATTLAPPSGRLSGGAKTTDALVRRYWELLVQGDTLAMSALLVSRAEYAYLYFPESVEGRSGMPPAVGWELIVRLSGSGLTRALLAAKRGPATLVRTTCTDVPPITMGESTISGPCGVVIRRDGVEETVWIAKSILTRDGVHKLLGLQNDLSGG